MIEIERFKDVRTIIGHKSCSDGTAAAMICARALSELDLDPEVRFVQYDTAEHTGLKPEPGQLFVDITPPVSRWEDWKGLDPIVLDHHESALPATDGLGGIYGYPEESGATLAFKHVMRPVSDWLRERDGSTPITELRKWERFADLCRLHDTWQDQHPEVDIGHGMAHGLGFYDAHELVESAATGEVDFEKLQEVGSGLYAKLMRKAHVYAKTAYRVDAKTYKLAFFNCSEKATSEAGHLLLQDGCDVAVGFFLLEEDGHVQASVSLRSHKGGVLVNKMAEKYGGGGHPPAAGFRLRTWSMADVIDAVSKALPE